MLSLICLNANMQTCETTGSQANTTVEVNVFQESGGTTQFIPLDIVVDGSDNKYLFYELDGNSDNNIRATKIATNGSYVWTKMYTGMMSKEEIKSVVISNDGNKIRMLSRTSGKIVQLSEISTSNNIKLLYNRMNHVLDK